MRGVSTWAVAVRTPDGDIDVAVHDVPGWAEKYSKIPLVRGVMNLGESMGLGMKALSYSANLQMPEDERLSGTAMGITMAISMSLSIGLFILLPALGARGLGSLFGVTGIAFHALEGVLVLSLFLGYLALIGRMKEIREGVPVPRCGTQVDRRVRERRAAHSRIGADLHDGARALRHQLPADGADPGDHRVLVHRPARDPVPDPVARDPDSGDCRPGLRGDPLRGQAHGPALGADDDDSGPVAPEAHHSRTDTRADRGRDRALRAVFTAEQSAEVDARVAA